MARKIAKTEYLMKPVDLRLVAALIALAVVLVFVFNMMRTAPSEAPPSSGCVSSANCPIDYMCYVGISGNSCFEKKCIDYCNTKPPVGCEGEWMISGKYPNCDCQFVCTFDMNCPAYCEKQPHIMCVGQWSISGVYPDCLCQWLCEEGGPV